MALVSDGILERVFGTGKYDGDGGNNYFSTSQAVTVVPTQWLDWQNRRNSEKDGVITRLSYWMNPTAAATYTLRIWLDDFSVTDAIALLTQMLHESAAARADSTWYDVPLAVPFRLNTSSRFYYSLEWTIAPGVTPGMIHLQGTTRDLR